VAVGQFIRDPISNFAEVAFTTHKDWRNRGIAEFLLQYLIEIAREKNIKGFTADVLVTNFPMMKVFSRAGYPMETRLEYETYQIEIPFGEEKKKPYSGEEGEEEEAAQ